jgi:hypothetical protein
MSYYSSARVVKNKILEGIADGIYDRQHILECCFRYMTDSDVEAMAERELLFEYEDEDEDTNFED